MLEIFKGRNEQMQKWVKCLELYDLKEYAPNSDLEQMGRASLYRRNGVLDCDSRQEILRRIESRMFFAGEMMKSQPRANADEATKTRVQHAIVMEAGAQMECALVLGMLHGELPEWWEDCTE